jgi:hypothetical protein
MKFAAEVEEQDTDGIDRVVVIGSFQSTTEVAMRYPTLYP